MSVQILHTVLVCVVSVVLQLPSNAVHQGHDHLHTNHLLPRSPTYYLKMVDKISKIVGRQLDPSSSLSNEDLLNILMNDSSTKVADLWKDVKEELNLDRKHNKEVTEHVVDGFCKRLDVLEKYVIDHSSKYSMLIADLDLKLKTISSYQEQLICDLSHKVHDLSGKLKDHVVSNHAIATDEKQAAACNDIQSICDKCGNIIHDVTELENHALHCHVYPHLCELCGYAFTSSDELQNHLREQHVSNNLNCTFCGELCTSSATLQRHMNTNHVEHIYNPEASFQNHGNLNTHIMYTSPQTFIVMSVVKHFAK